MTTQSTSMNIRTAYKLIPDLVNASYEVSLSGSSTSNGTAVPSSVNQNVTLDYMVTPLNALTFEYRTSTTKDSINPAVNVSDKAWGLRYLVKF